MKHLHISEHLGRLSLEDHHKSALQPPPQSATSSAEPTEPTAQTLKKAQAESKTNSAIQLKPAKITRPKLKSKSNSKPEVDTKLNSQNSPPKAWLAKLKPKKSKKIFALLAPAVLLVLFFILPNLIFKNRILPGTTFAGQTLSSNKQEALAQIRSIQEDYKLSLSYQDQVQSFSPDQIGFQPELKQSQEALVTKLNSYRFWQKPFQLFKSRNIEARFSLNQPQFEEFLKNHYSNGKLPEDAKIEFSTDQNKFTIIPEVAGLGLDSKKLATEIQLKLSNLNPGKLELQITNIKPEIIAQGLSQPLQTANSYLQTKITFQAPEKNYSPSAAELKDWLTLTPDSQNGTYQIKLNKAAADAYLDNLAKKLARKMEKRLVADIDGGQMVLQEGIPGRQVSNLSLAKTQFQNALTNSLANSKATNINLEFSEEPAPTENIAASGGRWIFADISKFRIYAYEGANLAQSFPMSSGKSSTPTPTGSYKVISKVRVKTMTSGGNKNSKDYYSVPNIEWVAYFKSGGYAMHGVYWHNKFGIENTSHGCMGMSNSDAQWVYNFVDIGTPVIIVS